MLPSFAKGGKGGFPSGDEIKTNFPNCPQDTDIPFGFVRIFR
jgi:hypothetical protein